MKKLALLVLALLALSVAKQADGFSGKIDVNAISALDSGASVPVIIVFKNATGKQAQSSSISAMASSFSTTRSYSLLNMAAGKANRQALEALQNNPNVEKVYYDYTVQLIEPVEPAGDIRPMLQDSVPLIGASNITVNNVSINGTGIKIGIIDTGVNYSHPDLGNCTTAQFLNGTCSKVVDGYDFANNDTDPMDDDTNTNGHGTHVAGIAAANGGIRGVAPGAQIIAVKVFTAAGLSTTSGILAGMEFAVLHGANIVSMSLGRLEIPHNGRDIMSLAADGLSGRALFTIAAGNSYTIGSVASPGLSAQAITVGATDKSDAMASFSSRGGTSDGRMDPDLVAPGVSINSTYWLGGYTVKSGTSMATPHVAGVAALVMQANPSWSISRVKQALVNTANNLNLAWKSQGSGRLNASGAVLNTIWVSPNYLQAEQYPNTTGTLLLNITNSGNGTISVNLTAYNLSKLEWRPSDFAAVPNPPQIGSGNITFNATSINITANGSAVVAVNVTVPAGSEAGQWEGFVNISTNRSIAVPLALTVPANTTFAGSVYYYQAQFICPDLTPCDSNSGDWQFYKFYVNSTAYGSIDVNVSWNHTGSDVDFYITDPKGNRFSAVANSVSTTFENRTITDIVPGGYLIDIHTYSINASTRPLNLTGIITYNGYATLSSNGTVDFGYIYPNATKTVSINITNTGASNLTIAVTNTALTEQWTSATIAASKLSYNNSFSLNATNAFVALNITLNATGATSGTYYGSITYNFSTGNLTLPIKAVVLLPNSTLNVSYSESVTLIPACTTLPLRELHLNTSLPNLVGFSTTLNWTVGGNISALLISPSGAAYNFTAGRTSPANFSVSPASGVWKYQLCSPDTSGAYTLGVQNLYNTYIRTYSDANFSTASSLFAPGYTVYYKVFVLDANNASANASANITIFDPSSATANATIGIFLGGNYTANYTLASNATNGTWRIVAYPSSNAVQNETSFNVTQAATRLSLPVEAAYRLNENITVVASVRDQVGNPVPNQNITLNITNSTNGTVFNATNQSNSSGYASFTFSINATGAYNASANSSSLSNSSTFLVQQLSQILLNTSASTYSPGSIVVFNVTLLSTNGTQMLTNETLNMTLKDPNNATNQTSVAYVVGNASLNLTLGPFATNGNWTLNVSNAPSGKFNSTVFFVNTTYNTSISVANLSVQPNATAVVYVNITNTGNTNNTFYVNFTRSANWSTNMTNVTLNLAAGQSANLPFNFSAPFNFSGDLNNITVILASQMGNLSMNSTFFLNISAVYNFTLSTNVSSATNFSIPDTVPIQITLQSSSNANDTIRIQTSANASGWNATMNQNFTDQNFSLNQSQQRNITLNVSVPGNAAGTVIITITATSLGNSAYNSQVNVTFTVPTVTVTTELSPLLATLEHYPSTNVLNFTFSASDPVDGALLPANLPSKACSLQNVSNNIVVNASSSGNTLYCTFTGLGPSLAQGDYAITISVNDSRNHTGSATIHAGNHQSMTVLVTNPGTLAVGASFFIDGTAYYNSGSTGGTTGTPLYWVYNGTVTAQIKSGTTTISTVNGSVTGGAYHLSATAPSTAGSYTITTTVGGIWSISGTGGPTAFSAITLGGGGGGGGGGGALPTTGALTVQPAITSTQAAAGGNTTFYIQLSNTYSTSKSVNISATEGGSAVHFDLVYSNATTILGNSNATVQVTVKPFKYAKPGDYTLNIQADGSAKTVTISIPKPALLEGAINANRYVELPQAQNESYVYLEVVNRLNHTANITVRETIPKNVSNSTKGILFTTPYTILVSDDPVVEWVLSLAPNESKELRYTVNHSIKNAEFPEPNFTFAGAAPAAPGGTIVAPENVTPENVTQPAGPEGAVVVGRPSGGIDVSIIIVIILVAGGAAAFAFKDAIREKLFKKPKPKVYETVPIKRAPSVFEAPKEEKKGPPPVFEVPPGPETGKEKKPDEKKPPAVYEEIKP